MTYENYLVHDQYLYIDLEVWGGKSSSLTPL